MGAQHRNLGSHSIVPCKRGALARYWYEETDMALFNVYEAKSGTWLAVVAAPTLKSATIKALREVQGDTPWQGTVSDLKVVESTPVVFVWGSKS